MNRSLKLLLAISLCLAFAAPASAATVVNGGFESGLSGWTADHVGSGEWVTYSAGTTLPSSIAPPSPRVGAVGAVSSMLGQSSVVLYQDVVLEPAYRHVLSFFSSYFNNAPQWILPASYSLGVENQQFSADVLRAGADPRTANPADILAKVDAPTASSPLTVTWGQKTADLTAFAGQTVRIRFVVVDTINFLHYAIDDVAITSADNTPPTITRPSFSNGKLRFTSDGAGSATVWIERKSPGKRSGKRCVKPTKRNKSKRNCKRWVKVGKSQASGILTGANSITVKTSSLKPGSYRVAMTATDASGIKTKPVYKTFKIRKKKKR